MSHFTVLVIGSNPEEQLAPFQETSDANSEYVEFEDKEDEWLEEYNTGKVKKIKMPDGSYLLPWDEKFRIVPGTFGIGNCTHKVPDGLKEEEIPFKASYKNFEEFVKEWHGMDERDEEEGTYGYRNNPNSKWDWYQIGGRWSGVFKLKLGRKGTMGEKSGSDNEEIPKDRVDQALKGDIDWDGMKTEQLDDLEKNWNAAQILDETEKEWRYKITKGMTKEQYFANNIGFSVFAVLKDGKWYEKGKMGCFACVSNEKDSGEWHRQIQNMIDELSDDTLMTFCDCHV